LVTETNAGSLADDLGGVDEVLEDGVVNGGECSRTGSLLSFRAVVSTGFREESPVCHDDDVFSRELLFELANETRVNTVEPLELEVRNEEDDGLLTAGNVHFLRGGYVQVLELGFQFVRAHFEVEQRLGDTLFQCIWLLSFLFHDFLS